MKKFFFRLGILLGVLGIVCGCFIALMSHVGMYIADPAFPYSYSVDSSDGKYLFVALGPKAREAVEGSYPDKNLEEARQLQRKYPASGLYLNDGSTVPLWIVRNGAEPFYSSQSFVSSDGHHVVTSGWWANAVSDEALTFYQGGGILKTYTVQDVASFARFLPGGHGHYDWCNDLIFDDRKKTLTLITKHYDRIVFDIATGTILSSFHPALLVSLIMMSVGSLVLFRLVQKLIYKNRIKQ